MRENRWTSIKAVGAAYEQSSLAAVWISVAMLAGGYARTRNLSAWTWFVLTILLGPLAVLLLVTWPARERSGIREREDRQVP